MKQPYLGKKLTELRKQRGITQEELVEKCNISVRTIQRIESGEVTPRSFTLRTILEALDCDWNAMNEQHSDQQVKRLQVRKNDSNWLRWAFYFGIVYFFIGFVEFYVDADIEFYQSLQISNAFYIGLKFISFVSMLFMYIGFMKSGTLFNNYILKISSLFIVIVFGIASLFDVIYWLQPSDSETYYSVVFSIVIGCLYVLNGIGIMRLKTHIGTNLTAITGLLLIVTGTTLISVFLFVFGLFLLIPINILQLILLFKIRELVLEEATEKKFI